MAELTTSTPLSSCCAPEAQDACCEPSEKESCCAANAAGHSCRCAAGQRGDIREAVREKYAAAARAAAAQEGAGCACGPVSTTDKQGAQVFGSALYDNTEAEGATETAVAASLGCGVCE